ncbi:MAG: hypothetical protein CL490_07335 [Acinetobacter sp.]|nr:hypothetical protein [Acinetobacter sp.]
MKKYDFDITVTGGTYAGELALPYVTAALLGAETIAKGRCRLIEGVQYKAVINNLSAAADFIQASNCSFNSGNDLTLTEQVVTLTDLKVNEEVCRGTLFPTWVAAQGSMSRGGDIPVEFADFMMATIAERTGTNLESIMWSGASPFGVGLLSDDGTIDEGGIDASAMKDFIEHDTAAAAWTSANILSHMSGVFDAASAVPGILQKPGCGFYLSYEAYAFFLQAIAAQSTNQGYNQDLGGATYLGYPVYATSGIPNTVDVMVFTYPDNIVVGTNNYTPNTSAQLIPTYAYDGSDNVRVALEFSVGVNVAVPGDGVVGFNFT